MFYTKFEVQCVFLWFCTCISENKVIIVVFSRIQPLTVLTVAQSFIFLHGNAVSGSMNYFKKTEKNWNISWNINISKATRFTSLFTGLIYCCGCRQVSHVRDAQTTECQVNDDRCQRQQSQLGTGLYVVSIGLPNCWQFLNANCRQADLWMRLVFMVSRLSGSALVFINVIILYVWPSYYLDGWPSSTPLRTRRYVASHSSQLSLPSLRGR